MTTDSQNNNCCNKLNWIDVISMHPYKGTFLKKNIKQNQSINKIDNKLTSNKKFKYKNLTIETNQTCNYNKIENGSRFEREKFK